MLGRGFVLACLIALAIGASHRASSAASDDGGHPGGGQFAGRASVSAAKRSVPPVQGAVSRARTREILIAFYHATGGQNWIENSNWLSDRPIGSWHGVTVDRKGQVTELQLVDNLLDGPIPAEIGDLQFLEVINLEGNRLRGQLPLELGQLRRLEYLNVGRNTLTGPVREGVLRSPSLHTLILHENALSGPVPSAIGSLSLLDYINLFSNEFSGTIPESIGNLENLRFLALSFNQLSGPIPESIGNLERLGTLYLDMNKLSGPIPESIGKLRNLVTLYLDSNRLSGPIPPDLGNLTRLRELRLHRNLLGGTIPTELGNLTALETLRLDHNRLTGPIPSRLGALADLDWLYLRGNRLTGCIPAVWTEFLGDDLTFLPLVRCPFGLPDLVASPGTLTPAFRSSHLEYFLGVGVGTAVATLQAHAGSSSVEFLNDQGNPMPDADVKRRGFQVMLDQLETFVAVRVESTVGVNAVTYNIQIRRGFPGAIRITDNEFIEAPGNPDLKHNIPDLEVMIGDLVLPAGFLAHFRATGAVERWGYPTSEVLVLEPNTLTQFYQRGVVDFHNLGAGWVVERRLAWDYVGGGRGGSTDQGVEEGITNPNPGRPSGPWGHKVANLAIDGTEVGFADFYERLGGVSAFGYAKTDARKDGDRAGTLQIPGATPGFIRQYFQAAVLEYHPSDTGNPVKLTLLGDTLRGLLVAGWENEPGFARAERLLTGEEYAVPVLSAAGSSQPPPSDVVDALTPARRAFEALRLAGSAQYELRGRWFGPGCGNNFYRWSEYRIGEIADFSSQLAYFGSSRYRYWFVDHSHWVERNGIWFQAGLKEVIDESGWLHGWTDPIPRIQHVLDFAPREGFESVEVGGLTVFKTSDVPILGNRLIREFEISVDETSNTIAGFGWTQRDYSNLCFKRVDARAGKYGIEFAVPESIR